MAEGLADVSALLGIVVSAIISILLSKTVAKSEFRKVRLEVKKTYESRLIEERLKRYPALFARLSQFIKDIEFGSVSRETIESFLAAVNDWDSQNAIILSNATALRCYTFRHLLFGVLRETTSTAPIPSNLLENLRGNTAEVEFNLRSDIGIYGIESLEEGDYEVRRVETFEQLNRATNKVRDLKPQQA